MSAENFIASARAMKGAEWRHAARKDWAVDCIGLVALSLAKAGRPVKDKKVYGREAWGDHLLEACRAEFGEPVQGPCAGDVVLIRWGNTAHMGILANHPDGGVSIIHAHNIHGVVEQTYSGPIKACTIAFFRPFPDLLGGPN